MSATGLVLFPFLIIPIPSEIPYGYGIMATNGPYGKSMIFRATKGEHQKIHRAAAILNISASDFMRRLANDAADYIIDNSKE